MKMERYYHLGAPWLMDHSAFRLRHKQDKSRAIQPIILWTRRGAPAAP